MGNQRKIKVTKKGRVKVSTMGDIGLMERNSYKSDKRK